MLRLERLMARLHARKPRLLRVLDRPEIPLHTNGATVGAAARPEARRSSRERRRARRADRRRSVSRWRSASTSRQSARRRRLYHL